MENILKKEAVKRVIEALNMYDPNLKVEVLGSSARTAAEAAKSLNCEVGAIVKSLLMRTSESFILCLIAGDKRCSLNKIKKITKDKDISMANADQVKNQTGFSIGGVAPIAHINKLRVLIDNSLSRFDDIYAAAGHPYSIFKISYSQLCNITNGEVLDIV